MIDFETTAQTPLELGKYPVTQTIQVNGATVVELTQFGKTFETQDVIPLVVCRPYPGAQLPQAVFEVKVRQLAAAAGTQLVELNKNKPLLQAEQV